MRNSWRQTLCAQHASWLTYTLSMHQWTWTWPRVKADTMNQNILCKESFSLLYIWRGGSGCPAHLLISHVIILFTLQWQTNKNRVLPHDLFIIVQLCYLTSPDSDFRPTLIQELVTWVSTSLSRIPCHHSCDVCHDFITCWQKSLQQTLALRSDSYTTLSQIKTRFLKPREKSGEPRVPLIANESWNKQFPHATTERKAAEKSFV